jgi:hypothetical protein
MTDLGEPKGAASKSAADAEQQAAQALRDAGFVHVRALATAHGRRTSDLVGEFHGCRFALEVRRAGRPLRVDASFEPLKAGVALPYPTLERYFELLWREKRSQLEATQRAERCDAAGLIIVLEGQYGVAWEEALSRAWKEAGEPATVRFALITPNGLYWHPSLGENNQT